MISVRHLKKNLRGAPVLTDVNFEVSQGEIVSVIGPSAVAKSTLLRCLNLLERPDGGEIEVDHADILAPGFDEQGLRSQVGMVFPQPRLFAHMNILDNLLLAPRLLQNVPDGKLADRARELLGMVGLTDCEEAMPCELSAGRRQRAAIARALAMNPVVLLFDNPTDGMDPTMAAEVFAVMRDLAQTGVTMVSAAREMRFAQEFSHRVLFLTDGSIVETGTPSEIFEKPGDSRLRAFLHEAGGVTFELHRSRFDLYDFSAQLEGFFGRRRLPHRMRNTLQLVLEELIVNILFPCTSAIRLQIAQRDSDGAMEIRARWSGDARNPLASEDETGRIARTILEKRCAAIDFSIAPDGRNELLLILCGTAPR